MWVINSVLDKIFDIIFLPFRSLNPWAGMAIVSLLTGLLMLFIFRRTSNQEGIRRVKNAIKAHLLEIRLFKDNMGVSLRAQGRILLSNLKYISFSMKPMLVMIVPILLILIQLNLWFGYRSLEPGQTAILKCQLEKGVNPLEVDVAIDSSPAYSIETPPLRLEEDGEINWRLRALQKGMAEITFRLNGQAFTKQLAIAQKPLAKVPNLRPGGNILDQVFNPGEKPLPKGLKVDSVEITYPEKRLSFFGMPLHWLIPFFALSIIIGFGLKGVFKVEI
jgi:hypothetical protein